MSKFNKIYLIDTLNNQILLIKYTKVNGQGIKSFFSPLKLDNKLKKEDLSKFITIDIEALINSKDIENNGDFSKFEPLLISAFNFYNNKKTFTNLSPLSPLTMEQFLFNFFDRSLHKFVIYAHNLTSFDGIFILKYLLKIGEKYDYLIEPIFRDSKLIMIKCRFGQDKNGRYRYYIEFHDSLLILNSSLKKLGETFLSDSPELMKMDNDVIMSYILNPAKFSLLSTHGKIEIMNQIREYCIQDCIALSHIIHRFALLIFKDYKINIHKYPTISSLAMGIYLTKYLKSTSLIPLVSGKIYRDFKKSYHGGHTDVYQLYSNEDVHSYDYSSMYPTQMLKHKMPIGKIDKFDGNILNTDNFQTLIDKLAFVKCSIYVDKSLNRPLYQTNIFLDGEIRSMCATGTFHNQWVFVPELAYYNKLTNGKIKILPDSITKGYLFNSDYIFKDYITDLYKIKNSVNKSDPWYLISKLLMNCLYGRMGLKQEIVNYTFLTNNEIEKITMLENDIKDVIDFDYFDKKLVISENKSDQVSLKSSVPIAAAISAYARMELAEILSDSELDILYIDTDSFKCLQKITELDRYKHLDFYGLGALKYEGSFSESIFLLPKVYGGIYKDSTSEITKVKGFKNKIEFNQLKDLLFKNKELKLTQNKWFRNMLKSEIKIMKTPYNLALNDNKRVNNLKTFKTNPYHFVNYDPESIKY